jgi:hypothetical protein
VMALLAPSVASWDVRFQQLAPEDRQAIDQLGDDIEIAEIGPGKVATVCRRLMPGMAPVETVLRVEMLIERDGTGPTNRVYRVKSRNAVA